MTASRFNRRRTLSIMAATAGLLCLGGRVPDEQISEWRGTALGAKGCILLAGMVRHRAREAIATALSEIERLEAVFSLYRTDSELSRLNASGHVDGPSHDMRVLTGLALSYWRRTDGAFNPAIQPLWSFLARHFAAQPTAEPDSMRLAELVGLADPRRISLEEDRIALAPGMALSFNGIAQGYITDRVAELLRRAGFTDVLVDLGEFRSLPGRPWTIAFADSNGSVDLANRALATSAPAGTRFTADGRWHHLLDPESGRSAGGFISVTVMAANAAEADALATAFAVSLPQAVPRLAARFPDIDVVALPAAGGRLVIDGGQAT